MKRAMTLLLGAIGLTGVSANAATIVDAAQQARGRNDHRRWSAHHQAADHRAGAADAAATNILSEAEMENDAPVAADRWPRGGIVEHGRLAMLGSWCITFALAIVFLWFGSLKFTAYEESGVAGFIMNRPLIEWLHGVFGIAGGAKFLGVFEILTGLLIAARVIDPRLSIIGGAGHDHLLRR